MNKKYKIISYLGEFIDHRLEREYFNYEVSNALRFIKPIMLVIPVLYLFFIIPDYYFIKNTDTLKNMKILIF